MENKIREEIKNITNRMEWKQRDLDRAVRDLEAAAAYSDYEIETFILGKIEEIRRYRADMTELANQKQMLEYLLNQ